MNEENRTPHTHQRISPPSSWVKRFAPLIPDGPVLDLACGGGRHGRHLRSLGHDVTFVDRDVAKVSDLASDPGATVRQYDLEGGAPWPFTEAVFSGIIVVNYLHRPLFPHLMRSLKSGGVLIYRTFARGNEEYGKPRNPDFLLNEDELAETFGAAMDIVEFEQGFKADPDRIVQGICAIRT